MRRTLAQYRKQYRAYYKAFATPDSPALRDASPTVVLIQGLGMFSFGKNKTEARIVGEFYTNAIHVMEGASLLAEGEVEGNGSAMPRRHGSGELQGLHQLCGAAGASRHFASSTGRWKRPRFAASPPEKEFSRRIALVVGGAAGLAAKWRICCAARGAHVMVADRDEAAAARVAEELKAVDSPEFVASSRGRHLQAARPSPRR